CPATETEEKNSTQTTPTEVTTTEAPDTHNSTSQNDSHTTSVGHGTEGSSGNWST
ncbi:Serine/threonine-protein kinase ATG1, partial [Clarias magur]